MIPACVHCVSPNNVVTSEVSTSISFYLLHSVVCCFEVRKLKLVVMMCNFDFSVDAEEKVVDLRCM